jgi:hypothetical protein
VSLFDDMLLSSFDDRVERRVTRLIRTPRELGTP